MAVDFPADKPGFRPTHPGLILRHDIEALGVTQEVFAGHIGVSRQTLSAIISGRSKLTTELACKISHAIGGTPRFWTNLQTAHDVWELEKSPRIAAIKKIRMAKRSGGLLASGSYGGPMDAAMHKKKSALHGKRTSTTMRAAAKRA